MHFLADSLGFLNLQGKPPVADAGLKLDLAHVTSAPPWCKTTEDILKAHNSFKECILSQDQLYPVLRSADLNRDEGTGVIFGLQSPPYDGGEASIRRLYDAGVRIMQLAYQENSPYGGGFLEPERDLSPTGREFILFCLQNKIIVDLSHASHLTVRSALKVARRGVFVSHTGCYDVYRHYPNPHPTAGLRNLPDDLLRGIVDKGGVVGLYTLTFALHPEDDSIEPFFQHLDHLIGVCGENAVAVGSDGVYVYQDPEVAAKQFGFMKDKLDPAGEMGARFPDQPMVLNSPKRMEYLFEAISERYSVAIAEKVCGKNLYRFFLENL